MCHTGCTSDVDTANMFVSSVYYESAADTSERINLVILQNNAVC